MSYTYTALIQGGEGDDVWDKEITLTGVDLVDAAQQVRAKAEAMGGWLVSIEQNDYGTYFESLIADKTRLDLVEDLIFREHNFCSPDSNNAGAWLIKDFRGNIEGGGGNLREALDAIFSERKRTD